MCDVVPRECKIHDITMQGIEAALKKRGYPSIEELRKGKRRGLSDCNNFLTGG